MVGLELFRWQSGVLFHIAGKTTKLELSAELLHDMRTVNMANGSPSLAHFPT